MQELVFLAYCKHVLMKRIHDAVCLRCGQVFSLHYYENWLKEKEAKKKQNQK